VLDFVLALAMPCPVSSNVPDANVFDFVLTLELALELALELDFELALELALDGRSATWEGSSTQGGSVGPATIQCKLSPCRDDCKGSLRAVKTRLSKDLMREVISGE